jgi:hypothetical protein
MCSLLMFPHGTRNPRKQAKHQALDPQIKTRHKAPAPRGFEKPTDRAKLRVSGHRSLMLYARRPQHRPQSNTNMPTPYPCGALQTQPTEPHSEFRVTKA